MKSSVRKLFLLFIFAFTVNFVYAQEPVYEREYGRVSSYELGMKEYILDKDAEAVVLYETGRYFFSYDYNAGFILVMEVKTKIKILKQSGIKYAEFEIPYYYSDEIERVYNLEGTTYNFEDGQIKRAVLEEKNVFDEKPTENWRLKRFAMPNVREGSVIEMKYTISTPYFFNMREWEFQKKIPVVYSALEYRAIPYYEYTYIVKGTNKLDELKRVVLTDEHRHGNLVYKEVAYHMGMKNLPAFKDEEFITSEKDYMIGLNFQIAKYHHPNGGSSDVMSTWPLICDDLLKHEDFGKYIKASEKAAQKILPDLLMKSESKNGQIKDITDYVKMNYNWNGHNGKYASLKVADFLKRKTGNAADINLFLAGMLQSAGFDAKAVILSTRNNGIVNVAYPFEKFLNYVVVQVSTKDATYLLDATESMLPFGDLPERCTNVRGLVIKPKSEEWIPVSQDKLALTEKIFDIKVSDNSNTLKVNVDVTSHANDAYRYRSVYSGDANNLVKMLRSANVEPIGEVIIKNYKELDRPFTFSYYSEPAIEQVDNKLFIAPFMNQSVTENIFKQAHRTLSIDLVLLHAGKYKSTIEIPVGYEVEFLPKSENFDNNTMNISYSTERVDNKIVISAEYVFRQNMYAAGSYSLLKHSFDWIVSKFNEMVVLQRLDN